MKKRGQFWETLIPWIIAIGVIVLFLILYGILSGRLNNIARFFEDWWRIKK